MTNSIIDRLKNERNKSDHTQYKHSAMILYKGRPLSLACNTNRTHPEVRRFSPVKTLHAEAAAIFKVKNRELLKNCTMIVYREDKQGHASQSKPCEVCSAMLKHYGIKQVTYSTSNGWVTEKF